MPLRVPKGPNANRPVDLDLTRHGTDFEPVAPLKQISIGNSAHDGVMLSSPGVALMIVGVNSPGSLVEDQGVFFGEVDTDTDAVAVPKLDGVDLSAVLRSKLSPEQLHYRVAMPPGSSLRGEDGGAVVERGDSTIARIPAPTAVDAQGTAVPLAMQVHSDELVVDVSHRESSYAYPILVDPELVIEISETSEGWEFYAESSDPYYCEGLSGGGISFVGCESSGPIGHSGPGGGAPVAATIASTSVPFGKRQYNPYQEREEEVEIRSFKGEQWWWPHDDGITSVEFIGISASGESGPDVYTYFDLEACRQFHEWSAPETTDLSVRITPTPEFGCNNWDMWVPEPISVRVTSGTTLQWERENPPWGDLVPGEQAEVGGTVSVDAVLITRNLGLQEEEELNPEKFGNGNPAEMSNTDCMSGEPVNCATGNLVETQQDVSVGGRGPGLEMTRTYNSQLAATEEEPGPFGFGWTGSYGDWIEFHERCIANCGGEVSFAAREGEGEEGEESSGGPVAAYSFDENEGEIAEDSAGNHDGSISGAEWTPGKFGPALKFTGSNPDMVTVPSAPDLELTEAFTIEAWVRPGKSAHFVPVVTKETSSYYGYALEAGGFEAGVPEGFISPKGHIENFVSGTEALPVHAWSNLALTFDGKTMRLYVDGNLVGSTATASPQGGAGPLQIGASELFGGAFTGKIDEIRIYDRALGSEEIQTDEATPIGSTEGSEEEEPEEEEPPEEEPEEEEEPPEEEVVEEIAVIHQDNGSTAEFHRVGGGPWTAVNPLIRSTLAAQEGELVYTQPDQNRFRFSGAGLLKAKEDRNGNAVAIHRDEQHRVASVSDESGRELTFSYDPEGFVETIEDPMGNEVHYNYEEGNLSSVSQLGESSPRWQFGYDIVHELNSVTDGRGKVATTKYQALKVSRQQDPLGREMHWEYEETENGSATTIHEQNGSKTVEEFNEDGLVTGVTKAVGTGFAATTAYEYNEQGEAVAVTDPNERTTEFGYDGEGNRESEVDAEGEETKWAYNKTHDVVSITTPRGETTTIERDANGNVESVSRPGPEETTQTTTLAYDEHGLLESLTDPLERTWSYGYDEFGDRDSEADPMGDTRTIEYNEDSLPIATVAPRGNVGGEVEPSEYETTIERDSQGRPETATDPLGHATEYSYDANGNLKLETDANGHTTSYSYDADGELTEVEKPSGSVVKTEYDSAGEVESQTDADEEATTYVRNALEQPIEVIDPLGRKTTQEFDGAGNLIAVIDPGKRETAYDYDKANRLTDVDYSEEATPNLEFEYDEDGKTKKMVDGTGESTFEYDQLGRLIESTDGHGDAVGYGYDLAEEPTSIVYPNGEKASREYDEAGRLESVTDWLGGRTEFAYSPDSSLEEIAFPPETGNVDRYDYDRSDRTVQAEFTEGVEALASLSYERDKVGQVEEEVVKGLLGPEVLGYGYDENDRLTSAGGASYEYDAADNIVKAPGTTNKYDPASQLEAGTGVGYEFDELGERIKRMPASGPATSYGYDQAGDLTSIDRPEEGEVSAISEGFAYDGTGLLASKESGAGGNYLSWDVSAPLPLLLADGENSYIYGPDGLPVEQISKGEAEAPTYLHHDQLGSTRLLTDASGKASATFTYEPFGGLAGHTGSATTPLGFAGQYTDDESGLQYLRARFYDPETSQFLSRDRLEKVTRQPYGYANGNPVNLIDPTGEDALPGVAGGADAVCGGTWEIPGLDVVTCGAAAAATAAAGAIALNNAISDSGDVNSDETIDCSSRPSVAPDFNDPSSPPAPGWEWRGNGPPGSDEGAWYNPDTGESLHPDLGHSDPIGPHYDYRSPNGEKFRVFPDGRMVPR